MGHDLDPPRGRVTVSGNSLLDRRVSWHLVGRGQGCH